MKVKVSCVQLFATLWTVACQAPLSLLQGIFPIQGSNPGLLHCRQILYCQSHQGSSKMMVAECLLPVESDTSYVEEIQGTHLAS